MMVTVFGIYVETSAKDNDNILSIFSTLIKAVVFNIKKLMDLYQHLLSKNGIIVNYRRIINYFRKITGAVYLLMMKMKSILQKIYVVI